MKRELMKAIFLLWYMANYIILVKTFWPYLQIKGDENGNQRGEHKDHRGADYSSTRPKERLAAQIMIQLGSAGLVWFYALIYLL